MAILPALTLIRIHTCIYIPITYYLLTSPSTISDQNLVFMLGEAMAIPQPTHLSSPTPATALAALLLALLALSDLTAFSLPDDPGAYFWSCQAPVRLAFFMAVAAYSYLGKVGGPLGGGVVGTAQAAVCNSLVFTWGFFEMVFWFWIWNSLRDERKTLAAGVEAKRKAEEDMM